MTVSCWSVLNYASHIYFLIYQLCIQQYEYQQNSTLVQGLASTMYTRVQEKHLQYAYVSIRLDAKISKYTEYYQLVRASTTLVRSRMLVCIARTIVRARIIYIYNTIVRYYAQYVCLLFILANSTRVVRARMHTSSLVCIQEVLCIIREYNITSQYYSQLEC